MKIVAVHWIDACTNSGYYDKEHPERFDPIHCVTVGHLVRKNRNDVVVASESFSDGDRRHIHTIPRGMVSKVVYLEGKDASSK